jgi:hypothetical protein
MVFLASATLYSVFGVATIVSGSKYVQWFMTPRSFPTGFDNAAVNLFVLFLCLCVYIGIRKVVRSSRHKL